MDLGRTRVTLPGMAAPEAAARRLGEVSRESLLRWGALAAVVLLAGALRFSNLAALGYANHYYAAAINSMMQSWHNFFFAAAEPGGAVSVDKPPVGLWFQVLSAYLFGLNGIALLLPQLIAGMLSVLVLYRLVGRRFGAVAGLLAALALAITPVVVATDRNNTMDSTLILTLLLAAGAFLEAAERGKLRFLLLGAVLVGIGFNIKMLQAFLPLPAFFALYFLGSPERLWRKGLNLALATLVLLVVSFSWAVIVDLTPADQRPYVGSSSDNTVMSLIFGYNGLERLDGMGGRGGLLSGGLGGLISGLTGGQGNPGGNGAPFRVGPGNGFPFQTQQPFPLNLLGNLNVGRGPGGVGETGQPGLLRLFIPPLSKEASWLLPVGLVSVLLLTLRSRLRWPLTSGHRAVVLWGGWLLTTVLFFSVAGFFHEYYLSMVAPALAAMAAIGVAEMWKISQRHRWVALSLLLVAAGATVALQMLTAATFLSIIWWLPFALGLFALGAALLIMNATGGLSGAAPAGFACVVAAMLLTPALWSGLTVVNASANQSLPSAYGGRESGPANRGGTLVNATLLAFLESHTQGVEYLMAVPSSMQGSDYVIATGRPVLYLGGFMGQDRVVGATGLAQLVREGRLRYIYWDSRGGNGFMGRGGVQSDISRWVTGACKPVQGYDTVTENAGAPDGTGAGQGAPFFGGRGGMGMQVTLYDCAS